MPGCNEAVTLRQRIGGKLFMNDVVGAVSAASIMKGGRSFDYRLQVGNARQKC